MLASVRDANASGAARRRQRRLRQWLRHERLSVAMALAEMSHHTAPRRQTMARAGGGPRVALHGHVPEHVPPQAAGAQFFAMDTGEDVGDAPAAERPAPLLEVLPQVWVQRRTVEQIVDPVPVVPMLHVLVPQMVEQLVDILAPLDFRIVEQVIEVPKIECPPRAARTVLREPQTVDQLVEVPTIVSWSLLQRIMEQNVDIPVPGVGGRRGRKRRTRLWPKLERRRGQDVDIPVPGGGDRSAGLQGFLPGQSSTSLHGPQERISERNVEQIAVSRVGDGLQSFLPEQSSTSLHGLQERISERNVEQIAVSRVGEGLQDFLPGQSSASSSRDPARGFEVLDEPGYGVFRTFPQIQKSAAQPPHSRSELPPHSSPWTPAPYDASMVLEEEEVESELDEAEEVGEVALMVEYVACDGRWWGQQWDPTAQQFCWWLAAADGSQLGHTLWRPPWDFPR